MVGAVTVTERTHKSVEKNSDCAHKLCHSGHRITAHSVNDVFFLWSFFPMF